jgi:hypothetical protein
VAIIKSMSWLEEYIIVIQIGMDQSPDASVQQIMLFPFNIVTSQWWALRQGQWVAPDIRLPPPQPRTILLNINHF